jgi:hypothetical protein
MYIESIQEALKSGSIKPNWGNKRKPIDVNNLDDLSGLMRGVSIIASFITRLCTKLIVK